MEVCFCMKNKLLLSVVFSYCLNALANGAVIHDGTNTTDALGAEISNEIARATMAESAISNALHSVDTNLQAQIDGFSGGGGPWTNFSLSQVTNLTNNALADGSKPWTNSASGTTNHRELSGLDYATSGHTGFQPSGDYMTNGSPGTWTNLSQYDNDVGFIPNYRTYFATAVSVWGAVTTIDTTVSASDSVVDIGAGSGFQVALYNNGSVFAWGTNNNNQLDIPNLATSGVSSISAGGAFVMALRTNGQVVAWGRTNEGQCIIPTLASNGVIAISAGGSHALALLTNGQVVAWGYNAQGQCNVPALASNGVVAIAGGHRHSLALLTNGQVVAWGQNTFGQLAVPVSASNSVIAIASKYNHSLAIRTNGQVVAWGLNSQGQCNVPSAASNGIVRIACGFRASYGINATSNIVAWGDSSLGQLAIPITASNMVLRIDGNLSYAMALAIVAKTNLVVYDNNSKLLNPDSVVYTNDLHLTNDRYPTAHNQDWITITNAPNTVWYVATNGNDTNIGRALDSSFATISNAIAQANNGDIISVGEGSYILTTQLVVNMSLTLIGATNRSSIIDANFTDRCLLINSSNVTVRGFTFVNGFTPELPVGGAGISAGSDTNLLGNIQIHDCNIVSNNAYGASTSSRTAGGLALYSAENNYSYVGNCYIAYNICTNAATTTGGGGGFFIANSTITNCTVVYNSGFSSGGGRGYSIQAYNSSFNNNFVSYRAAGGLTLAAYTWTPCYVANCDISGNTVGRVIGTDGVKNGGGVSIQDATVYNCTIWSNVGAANGGGVFLYDNGILDSCSVRYNQATLRGGGVRPATSTSFYTLFYCIIKNCFIADNICSNICGGVNENTSRGFEMYNTTIVNNYSTNSVAGSGGYWNTGTGFVYNCIIYSNYVEGAHNNVSNHATYVGVVKYWNNCIGGNLDPRVVNIVGTITNEPAFRSDYSLDITSPCIDKGTNYNLTSFDYFKNTRVKNFVIDIGMSEFQEESDPAFINWLGTNSMGRLYVTENGVAPLITSTLWHVTSDGHTNLIGSFYTP